jgi:hypothetical protein
MLNKEINSEPEPYPDIDRLRLLIDQNYSAPYGAGSVTQSLVYICKKNPLKFRIL